MPENEAKLLYKKSAFPKGEAVSAEEAELVRHDALARIDIKDH